MAITQSGTQEIIFGAQGDVLPIKLHVKYIRWVGGSAAGHRCIVKDAETGAMLFKSVADGNYFIDVHPLFQIVPGGIDIDTLDSGEVFVYIR